ncbi:MAG: pyridoxamine 5'-phosphate oxidase [Rhodospirillaceae bacterium]
MSSMEDQDPYALFAAWMSDAEASEANDANAMALATADKDGWPAVRMVLLKGVVTPQEAPGEDGFVFYSNKESHKGQDLTANPKAALCFHWKSLRRQIRVEGPVLPVADEVADAYFDSRPLQSRIGAWASQQSRPLEGKWALEKRVAEFTAKYALGKVPRPPYWVGFRLHPHSIEFWHDRPYRLHDRIVYERPAGSESFAWTRLYP